MADDAIAKATEKRIYDLKPGDMVDFSRNGKEYSGVVQSIQNDQVSVLTTDCNNKRVSKREITRVY